MVCVHMVGTENGVSTSPGMPSRVPAVPKGRLLRGPSTAHFGAALLLATSEPLQDGIRVLVTVSGSSSGALHAVGAQ